MKSWQSILDEQIYIDDTFELDDDNTAFIVDGVLKSYKTKLNILYHQAKLILDEAYKAGFKLEQKKVDSKTIYVLCRCFKGGALIIEFTEHTDYLLKSYVVLADQSNVLNVGAKTISEFPIIFNNHNVKEDINTLDVTVVADDLSENNTYLYIKERMKYEMFFKYLYVFTKVMVSKLSV